MVLCAREAIRNAAVHAKATTLTIKWSVREAGVDMVIADNGTGIKGIAGNPARNGLRNMLRRAQEHGWELTVGHASPQGTAITLHMPLRSIHPYG